LCACLGLGFAAGAHNLINPVAATAHRVEGQVGGALVDGAGDAGARVAETVDKLLAGEGVGEDADVQALRIAILQDSNLRKYR
jgi:hypothetical protein